MFGLFSVLAAVFFHSFGTVWVKQVASELPVYVANTGGLVVVSLLYVMSWIVLGEDIPENIPEYTAYSITYLAVFGSVFGALLFYYALRHVSASSIGLLPLITPVTCLLLGQWFNGEIITVSTIVGTAIILSGLLVYQGSTLIKGVTNRYFVTVEQALESEHHEK